MMPSIQDKEALYFTLYQTVDFMIPTCSNTSQASRHTEQGPLCGPVRPPPGGHRPRSAPFSLTCPGDMLILSVQDRDDVPAACKGDKSRGIEVKRGSTAKNRLNRQVHPGVYYAAV